MENKIDENLDKEFFRMIHVSTWLSFFIQNFNIIKTINLQSMKDWKF